MWFYINKDIDTVRFGFKCNSKDWNYVRVFQARSKGRNVWKLKGEVDTLWTERGRWWGSDKQIGNMYIFRRNLDSWTQGTLWNGWSHVANTSRKTSKISNISFVVKGFDGSRYRKTGVREFTGTVRWHFVHLRKGCQTFRPSKKKKKTVSDVESRGEGCGVCTSPYLSTTNYKIFKRMWFQESTDKIDLLISDKWIHRL